MFPKAALIYVSQSFPNKPWKKLHICCTEELESVFLELLMHNKENRLVGVKYRHPTIKHHKFNEYFMNIPLGTPTRKHPSVISGNFNLSLINYTQNRRVNQFFQNVLSNNFIPNITPLKSVTEKSAKLIDNIFTNNYGHNCVSSNTTTYISDHLPQFVAMKYLLLAKKIPTISFRDYRNFSDNSFKGELRGLHCLLAV